MFKHLASPWSKSELSIFDKAQVQPNALDLKLDKVLKIDIEQEFILSEDIKKHRGSIEMQPDKEGFFYFSRGSYEIVMEGIVTIGSDEIGWVIPRSTLNRNGLFITSGLYDSGYSGVMAGVLHVIAPAKIAKGTRIGQMLIADAEQLGEGYAGSYGAGTEHDKKYGV